LCHITPRDIGELSGIANGNFQFDAVLVEPIQAWAGQWVREQSASSIKRGDAEKAPAVFIWPVVS
jgi:hypothetical protein